MDYEHPLQSRRLDLDDPTVRRRALAADAAMLADQSASLRLGLQRARAGGRELGVPPPRSASPDAWRQFAADLERANGLGEAS